MLPKPENATVADITRLSEEDRRGNIPWLLEVVSTNADSSPRRSALVALRDLEAPELRPICLQYIVNERSGNQNLWETAVKCLGVVGRPEDLALLEDLASREHHARFGRRAARKAARVLRKRLGFPDDPNGEDGSGNGPQEAPRVFVSYSWESENHKDWVRKLAERLRSKGVDARLDQWFVRLGESFTQFMEVEVRESNFVLVVCTPTYARKSNDREGGVGYEQQIVSGELVAGAPRSKFVPAIRFGQPDASLERAGCRENERCAVPTHFLAARYVDFRDDLAFEDGVDELVNHMLSMPVVPPIGSMS